MSGYPTISWMISEFSDTYKAAGKIKEPALHQLKLLAIPFCFYALFSFPIFLCLLCKWLRPDTEIPKCIVSSMSDSLSLPLLFGIISIATILHRILVVVDKIIGKFSNNKLRLLGLISLTSDFISTTVFSFASSFSWTILIIWAYQHSFNKNYHAPLWDAIVLSLISLFVIFCFVLCFKLHLIKWLQLQNSNQLVS